MESAKGLKTAHLTFLTLSGSAYLVFSRALKDVDIFLAIGLYNLLAACVIVLCYKSLLKTLASIIPNYKTSRKEIGVADLWSRISKHPLRFLLFAALKFLFYWVAYTIVKEGVEKTYLMMIAVDVQALIVAFASKRIFGEEEGSTRSYWLGMCFSIFGLAIYRLAGDGAEESSLLLMFLLLLALQFVLSIFNRFLITPFPPARKRLLGFTWSDETNLSAVQLFLFFTAFNGLAGLTLFFATGDVENAIKVLSNRQVLMGVFWLGVVVYLSNVIFVEIESYIGILTATPYQSISKVLILILDFALLSYLFTASSEFPNGFQVLGLILACSGSAMALVRGKPVFYSTLFPDSK